MQMRIGIIGGTNGLGKTFARYLSEDGNEVIITGRDVNTGAKASEELGVEYSKNNAKTAEKCDIVIVAVPIASTNDVIEELAPHMQKGSLMMDVTSVKEGPTKKMEECLGEDVDFIPMHPIFGPRTPSLDGQVIVLTPTYKGDWYRRIYNYLDRKNTRIMETTPENHDRMMAVVQVLTHFSYISTASAIEKLKIDIKDTEDYESPIYNLMIDTIARIVSQNPYLTYSIQHENKAGEQVRQAFADSVLELKDAISREDEEEFVEIAIRATKHMGDIQGALGRSDKAIDSLTKEFNQLKDSLGEEIALKHIYSNTVHIGVLEDIDYNIAKLRTKNNKIKKLKVANIRILNENELFEWKMLNEKILSASISCIFPKDSDSEIIRDTLSNIKNITNVEIKETYNGPQIKEGGISYTFIVESFEKEAIQKVKNTLKGFGGVLR